MKRLIIALVILAGTLAASSSQAQVCVGGRISFGFPPRRVYVAPPVSYEAPYAAPYYYGDRDYYRDRAVVPVPAYGYGYRRYDPYCYHERRWRHWRRW